MVTEGGSVPLAVWAGTKSCRVSLELVSRTKHELIQDVLVDQGAGTQWAEPAGEGHQDILDWKLNPES